MHDTRFVQETLANGLTLVIEVMAQVPSVACGFLARTGARDDPPQAAGVSHFLEHMMFKGTPNRTWEQLNIDFDQLGAQYNAYTSKDRTFYYGWVRAEDLDRQLEILADMMRSTLPPDQFDMEKNVILEEIAMSNDDLASNAYDFIYEVMCPGSSLAWPVLGTESSIQALTRDQMQAYFARRYAPDNLILAVAGRVDPDRVIASAERLCGHWTPADDLDSARQPPTIKTGTGVRRIDRFHQQAVMLSFPSVSACHPLDSTAQALAAVLGGPNSRFYWNIMQKGLSIQAGVYREEYGDFGMLTLYGLCEPANCEKLLDAMRHEAAELTSKGALPKEVQRVKNLRRTSLAAESEAPYYRIGQIIDDVDYRGAPRPAEERQAAVDAVSEATIAEYLEQCPIIGDGFLASVGPRDWPT